jgi:hypothetical protein
MAQTNFDSVYASGPVYSQGVPVVPFTTGTVRYVSSTTTGASDNHPGTDATKPLSTVDAAIGKCTANVGDVIVLMPGHAETVTATSIALDVAGVTIVGLGTGLKRPTFTFGAAAATITVSADNCVWSNCRFVANFADVAAAFTVGAAKDLVVKDSSFIDTSSILNFLSMVVTGATNNAADGLTFTGNYIYGLAATDGAVVSVLGNLLRLNVSNNVADKAATNNAGHFITLSSKLINGARIRGNTLTVVGATNATVGIFLTGSGTTSTGVVADNLVASLDTTTELIATAGTGLAYFNNYYTGTADASGKLWPAVDGA